jgi:hypothetical protein
LKKRSQTVYWIIFIVFVAIVLFAIFKYGKTNNQNTNNAVFTNSAKANINPSTNSGNDSSPTNNSAPTNQNSDLQISQQSLTLFLKAITPAGNKSNIKTYSTSDFYASQFVNGIVNGTSAEPDQANITSSGEKISNTYVFQVNESYNVSKSNNAGETGIYFYGLIKSGNSWLVNYRGENKPS